MRNEMGNTNTTEIIQEEEGAAAAALSLNDSSSANDHNIEKLTSITRNEQDTVDKEHTSRFSSEVQLEAEDSPSDIQKVERLEEPEKAEYGENNQNSIQSSTHSEILPGEVVNIDSNLEFESDEFTHSNGPIQPLHVSCNPSSREEENSADMDDYDDDDDKNRCEKTEIEHTGAAVASGVDAESADKENNELMMEETASQPDRLIKEIAREEVENGNNLELNLPSELEEKEEEEENVTKMNTALEEKSMILPEEINMDSNEPENGQNCSPVNHTESLEQEVNEFKIGNTAESEMEEDEENSISCLETKSIEQQLLESTNSQPHIDSIVQKLGEPEDCQPNEEHTIKQIFAANEVEATPGTAISEKEMQSDLNGTISPLPIIRSKIQETARRYSVDYTTEHPANQIETTRRAPSFDFGIPFDAKSSESDQTPLLRPEKPPPPSTRRLSIDFQNYGRENSLDYDTMGVEEKTIRVERSDSDAPFLITLKKEGSNGNFAEESLLAEMKEGKLLNNTAADELALTSSKSGNGNGKRKPVPSFFTTCICCIASSN